MTDILMPKLSDSMEGGTIISWFKSTGDQVEVGDELLEIETDKATMAHHAEIVGVLEILAPVGTTVPVGEPIARIGAAAQTVTPRPANPSPADPVPAATANATPALEVQEPHRNRQTDGEQAGRRATPLARRVAEAHGVALAEVRGTGPLGRITRGDVLAAAGIAAATPGLAAPQTAPRAANGRQELSRAQRLVARRMSEAKATIPHFQVHTEVAMDAALKLRASIKGVPDAIPALPSINDMIVRAAALALRSHPLANGSYRDGAFELHDAVNVGIAVATDDGLVVPILFDADTKTLVQMAAETRRLVAAVRAGTITPPEVAGGTFTVSNLGMFGMTAVTPVINPPQAAILGVGALRPVLARVNGEIVDQNLLTLSLSCDHRILYGADASRFLAHVRDLLEAPLRLVL